MREISNLELENISGGDSSISGPVLSAVFNIIKLLQEAGRDLGSGMRRIAEGNICPLK